jgi:hypothetical protein
MLTGEATTTLEVNATEMRNRLYVYMLAWAIKTPLSYRLE